MNCIKVGMSYISKLSVMVDNRIQPNSMVGSEKTQLWVTVSKTASHLG